MEVTVMIIDPAQATQIQIDNKSLQKTVPSEEIVGEKNLNNEGSPDAGQTSSYGPAVVTNISAAGLEAANALNAPEQTADETRSTDVVEGEEKGQNRAANEEYVANTNQAQRQSQSLDVVA